MSPRLPLLALFGSVFLASSAIAAPSANEAAILKIEQDMTAAQTMDSIIATWDKNVVLDDMITMSPRTSEYVGLDAVRKDLGPQFDAVSSIDTHILRIKVVADNRLGFAFSTQHLLAKGKGKAPNLDFVFRETDCFQKKGGKWVLVHQQLSVPFDPRTGMAVLNTQ